MRVYWYVQPFGGVPWKPETPHVQSQNQAVRLCQGASGQVLAGQVFVTQVVKIFIVKLPTIGRRDT